MKIAIMQPYLFPYIGYFQLINAVDTFVIFDDVNYIKRGWINRNRILSNGKEHIFTLNLSKASQNKLINEIKIFNDKKNKEDLFELFRRNYNKAPQFNSVVDILKEIILNPEDNLNRYIEFSIKKVSEYLDIKTRFIRSSVIKKNNSLSGKDKIIEIAKILNVDTYINLSGGIAIYDKEFFKKNNINLFFIKTKEIRYEQFNNNFIPDLSIIDVLMFNLRERVIEMLKEYILI